MGMITILIILSIFHSSLQTESKDTPILTFMIHRHGARNPTELFRPDIFPGKKSQLTEVGKEQMRELGSKLRGDLIDNGVLSTPFNPEEVLFFSSPVDRAKQSLLSFIEGFVHVGESPNWTFTQLSTPFQTPCKTSKCLFFLPKENDIIFHGESAKTCPINQALGDAIKETAEYKSNLAEMQKTVFPFIAEKFNYDYDTKFDLSNVTWDDFSHMNDVLYSAQYIPNGPLPDVPVFSKKWMEEIRRIKFYQQFIARYSLHGGVLSSHASTTFFSLIKKYTQEKISSKTGSNLKYIHFSGHDVSLAGILLQLVDLDEYSQREDAFIPFAASLMLQVFQDSTNNYKVEATFNGEPLVLKGVGKATMDWNDFNELLSAGIDSNFPNNCQQKTISKSFLSR